MILFLTALIYGVGGKFGWWQVNHYLYIFLAMLGFIDLTFALYRWIYGIDLDDMTKMLEEKTEERKRRK